LLKHLYTIGAVYGAIVVDGLSVTSTSNCITDAGVHVCETWQDSHGSLVEGDIRVHMNVVSPVTMHMPLTLRDAISSGVRKRYDSSTVTFCVPPDTSKLIHITRYGTSLLHVAVCCVAMLCTG